MSDNDVIDINEYREGKTFTMLSNRLIKVVKLLMNLQPPSFSVGEIERLVVTENKVKIGYIILETIKVLDYDYYFDMILDVRMDNVISLITKQLTGELDNGKNKPEGDDNEAA